MLLHLILEMQLHLIVQVLYEGTYVTVKYVVDTSDAEQRFILTDNRADTTTLRVRVQTSVSDSTVTTYTKATDITQLSATSSVYFLQEVENGRFEVYFGDDVVSKALSDGNVVILNYVVTNKTAMQNGASSFSAPSTIDGVSTISNNNCYKCIWWFRTRNIIFNKTTSTS